MYHGVHVSYFGIPGTMVAILWVGTNSGDVAAYVINVVLASQDGSSARKVELLPTGWCVCVCVCVHVCLCMCCSVYGNCVLFVSV